MKTTTKMVSALLGAGVLIATLASKASADVEACNADVGQPHFTVNQWDNLYVTCNDSADGYSAEAIIGGIFEESSGDNSAGYTKSAALYHVISGSDQGYLIHSAVHCPDSWHNGTQQYFSGNSPAIITSCNGGDTAYAGVSYIEMIDIHF